MWLLFKIGQGKYSRGHTPDCNLQKVQDCDWLLGVLICDFICTG